MISFERNWGNSAILLGNSDVDTLNILLWLKFKDDKSPTVNLSYAKDVGIYIIQSL